MSKEQAPRPEETERQAMIELSVEYLKMCQDTCDQAKRSRFGVPIYAGGAVERAGLSLPYGATMTFVECRYKDSKGYQLIPFRHKYHLETKTRGLVRDHLEAQSIFALNPQTKKLFRSYDETHPTFNFTFPEYKEMSLDQSAALVAWMRSPHTNQDLLLEAISLSDDEKHKIEEVHQEHDRSAEKLHKDLEEMHRSRSAPQINPWIGPIAGVR